MPRALYWTTHPSTIVTPSSHPSITKLFWGEEIHVSESQNFQKVYKIGKDESNVKNHVPEMKFWHEFSTTCTHRICKHLNLPTKGAQTLFLLIFWQLMQIMKLVGDKFLKCWLEAVKCDSISLLSLNSIWLSLQVISYCGGKVSITIMSAPPIWCTKKRGRMLS